MIRLLPPETEDDGQPPTLAECIQYEVHKAVNTPPRDCVRQLSNVGGSSLTLVGYNRAGDPAIKIEVPAGEPLGFWTAFIEEWMHEKYGAAPSLELVK